MFDPVVSGVKAFGSAVAAVPDSVYDGVTKVGSAASNVLRVSLISPSNGIFGAIVDQGSIKT